MNFISLHSVFDPAETRYSIMCNTLNQVIAPYTKRRLIEIGALRTFISKKQGIQEYGCRKLHKFEVAFLERRIYSG